MASGEALTQQSSCVVQPLLCAGVQLQPPAWSTAPQCRLQAPCSGGYTVCTARVVLLPVHDGTMPFSSGAVSYKSSTTESSTIDGLEEATISCGVTAAGAAGSAGKGEQRSQQPPRDCRDSLL